MAKTEILEGLALQNVVRELLPVGYELLSGVNQIYELELALAEFRSLTKEELLRRSAYFYKVDGLDTYHYQLCMGAPLQIDKSTSMRLRTFFQAYQFKTGYATHGLFPYRGKFHPQLIKAIMNLIGVKPGDTVLDPMTGSGTTNIEASILGIDSIGVDASPFCCLMAKVKAEALTTDLRKLQEYAQRPSKILEHYHNNASTTPKLAQQIDNLPFVDDPFFNNFFKLCYLDAVGYARRRARKTVTELFPIVLNKYVHALINFLLVKEKLGLKLGKVTIVEGDARNLNNFNSDKLREIKDESIDGIITSPPYSFAIDYLDEDQLQLEYMGYNIEKLGEKMIGLRGQNAFSKVRNYLKDMDAVIAEISRVLKKDKYCIIVIGSNVIQLERTLDAFNDRNHTLAGLAGLESGIRLEDALGKIACRRSLNLVKRLSRPIEGIRNVMRTEEALFFRKK